MQTLTEIFHAKEYSLLLENASRAIWLIQNMGPKLEAKYLASKPPAAIQRQIESQPVEGLAAKIVSYIMAADPTPSKGYARWIASRYTKSNEPLEAINGDLAQELAVFGRAAAAKRVNGNLDAIPSFEALKIVVRPFMDGTREVSANKDRANKRDTSVDTDTERLWVVQKASIIKKYGPALLHDFREQAERLPAEIIQQIGTQEKGHEDETIAGIVGFIMSVDPSKDKSISPWVAKMIVKESQLFEDVPGLANTLPIFIKAARAGEVSANMDDIDSFSELYTLVEPFMSGSRELTADDGGRLWGENDPMRKQAKVYYDGDDYIILDPQNPEAAKYFGRNTNWCTTSTMFHSYWKPDSPLWITLRRADGRKWQFHFNSAQFMDERDRQVNLDEWIDENKKAFEVIGPDKFFAIMANGKRAISARHFSPELIAKQPDELVAKVTRTMKDLAAIPKQRALSEPFMDALIPHLDSNIQPSVRYYMGDEEVETDLSKTNEEKKKMLGILTSRVKDEKFWNTQCGKHDWLLKELPVNLQTDGAKEALTGMLQGRYRSIENLVPKPWTEKIEQHYWALRTRQDSNLLPSEVPERFLDDGALAYTLAYNPEEMTQFQARLKPDLITKMVSTVLGAPHRLKNLVENLPEQFKTAKLLKGIYTRVSELRAKASANERDDYLEILTMLKHEHWPSKFPAIHDRMATLNKNFEDNPAEHHNPTKAAQWVARHPEELYRLPQQYITQETVDAALVGAEDTVKHGRIADHLRAVLEPCDPAKVPPELVSAAIKKLGDLSQNWEGIPAKYMAMSVREALAAKGDIPFDDPRFPPSGFTPANIVARFNKAVSYTFRKTEHLPANPLGPYGAREARIKDLGSQTNLAGMKEAWDSLPESIDHHAVLKALLTSTGGKDGGHSKNQVSRAGVYYQDYNQEKGTTEASTRFSPLLTIADPKLLDADMLTAWLSSIKKDTKSYYGPRGGDQGSSQHHDGPYTKYFECFPKESYTAENMAIAVKKKIIDQVPEELIDDDVYMNMFKDNQAVKNVDWNKVTPSTFQKYAARSGWDAALKMAYAKDEGLPPNHPLFQDANLARQLMRMLPKDETAERDYMGGARDDQCKTIYNDHPERRVNWDQAMYDRAAGTIVEFKNIPEKFRSDQAIARVVKETPGQVNQIPNAMEWLNKHKPTTPDGSTISMIASGMVQTPAGWVNSKDLPKTTVPGVAGSYAMTKIAPKGECMVIFNKQGEIVNTLMAGVTEPKKTGYGGIDDPNMLAHHNGTRIDDNRSTSAVGDLMPYRLLIADAFAKHPEFQKMLPIGSRNYHSSSSLKTLEAIRLFGSEPSEDGGDRSGPIVPVENLPRDRVSGELTIVQPDGSRSRRWGGGGLIFLFRGQGKLIGTVSFGETGSNVNIASASVRKSSMPDAMACSKDLALYFAKEGVASGKNPGFMESDFYQKLGLRGPGKGEWMSLLNEKIAEQGDYAVWKLGPRLTVTDAKQGVLFSVKTSKQGYAVEYRAETITPEEDKAAQELISANMGDVLKDKPSAPKKAKVTTKPRPKDKLAEKRAELLKLARQAIPERTEDDLRTTIAKWDEEKLDRNIESCRRKLANS